MAERMVPRRDADVAMLVKACAGLQPAQGNYLETDYPRNLMLTVLDLRLHPRTLERALNVFRQRHGACVRTLDDLQQILNQYPDNREGNTELAQSLWGYNLWTRAATLRGLVQFCAMIGVTDQETLHRWAARSTFRDFDGRVKGLGPAAYQWLVMRQGVETVKPDVHLHRFVKRALGREVSDWELVELMEEVARRLDKKAHELDWSIWEHERGAPGAQ